MNRIKLSKKLYNKELNRIDYSNGNEVYHYSIGYMIKKKILKTIWSINIPIKIGDTILGGRFKKIKKDMLRKLVKIRKVI
jgi:hypothetical protein